MRNDNRYKFSTITLAIILVIIIVLNFISHQNPDDSSMEAQYMWFTLASVNSDLFEAYELVSEKYPDVITEEDFIQFRNMASNGMRKYPSLLCEDIESNTLVLVQFSKNPEDGSYRITHVQPLSDTLSKELSELLVS